MYQITNQDSRTILIAMPQDLGYSLLDSGDGRKLERFGSVIVDREDMQSLWTRRLSDADWQKADAVFTGRDEDDVGRWRARDGLPDIWPMDIMGVTAQCRLSAFRHLGVFPEQTPHWQWMRENLTARIGEDTPQLLNLFGYTGIASLIAAQTGAEVTHVDASKKAIEWARANQAASNLQNAKIRWITDDARKFAAREGRRHRQYDGILLDPPKFGRGPDGEVWDIFQDLPEMLNLCRAILKPNGFLVLTTYAVRASSLAFEGLLRDRLNDLQGQITGGELALQEVSGGRLLPTSHFCRWQGRVS